MILDCNLVIVTLTYLKGIERTLLFATKVEAIKKNILKNKAPICFIALQIKINFMPEMDLTIFDDIVIQIFMFRRKLFLHTDYVLICILQFWSNIR